MKIRRFIRDFLGNVMPNATVTYRDSSNAVIGSSVSDADGITTFDHWERSTGGPAMAFGPDGQVRRFDTREVPPAHLVSIADVPLLLQAFPKDCGVIIAPDGTFPKVEMRGDRLTCTDGVAICDGAWTEIPETQIATLPAYDPAVYAGYQSYTIAHQTKYAASVSGGALRRPGESYFFSQWHKSDYASSLSGLDWGTWYGNAVILGSAIVDGDSYATWTYPNPFASSPYVYGAGISTGSEYDPQQVHLEEADFNCTGSPTRTCTYTMPRSSYSFIQNITSAAHGWDLIYLVTARNTTADRDSNVQLQLTMGPHTSATASLDETTVAAGDVPTLVLAGTASSSTDNMSSVLTVTMTRNSATTAYWVGLTILMMPRGS